MTSFSPESFLGTNYSEGFDTRYAVHRPGDFKGYVGKDARDINAREVQTKDGPRVVVDVALYTDNPEAVGEGGKAPARARMSIWIDQTESGSLDRAPGKNRQLGAFLLALGFQDKTGMQVKPWSWQSFHGMSIGYRVVHEARKDTGDIVANVSGVVPA